VPDSPTFVYIAPECGDAKLVTVHGIQDRGLKVRGARASHGHLWLAADSSGVGSLGVCSLKDINMSTYLATLKKLI
jgi:hypothetical protein